MSNMGYKQKPSGPTDLTHTNFKSNIGSTDDLDLCLDGMS